LIGKHTSFVDQSLQSVTFKVIISSNFHTLITTTILEKDGGPLLKLFKKSPFELSRRQASPLEDGTTVVHGMESVRTMTMKEEKSLLDS